MSDILKHLIEIDNTIGSGKHYIDAPLLGMRVWFYIDDIVSKAKYIDAVQRGETSMGLVHMFVQRARDENMKLVFGDDEAKKLLFGNKDKPGLKTFAHICEAARMMLAYDNKVIGEATDQMKKAEEN